MMRAAKQPPSVQNVREVAQDVQAAVWSERATRLLRGLRALLEDEVTTQVGAARYARTPARSRGSVSPGCSGGGSTSPALRSVNAGRPRSMPPSASSSCRASALGSSRRFPGTSSGPP